MLLCVCEPFESHVRAEMLKNSLHAGWSFQKSGAKKRQQDGTVSWGVPYSEHSSWNDLRACVQAFRPKKLVWSLPLVCQMYVHDLQ